jgi:hypothetical protein
MNILITILAPEADGEAILQLIGDDPRFVVMSKLLEDPVPEPNQEHNTRTIQVAPATEYRVGSYDRSRVERLYSERILGRSLIEHGKKHGFVDLDTAQKIAESLGYKAGSASSYLSGLTAKEGIFSRKKADGKTFWLYNIVEEEPK